MEEPVQRRRTLTSTQLLTERPESLRARCDALFVSPALRNLSRAQVEHFLIVMRTQNPETYKQAARQLQRRLPGLRAPRPESPRRGSMLSAAESKLLLETYLFASADAGEGFVVTSLERFCAACSAEQGSQRDAASLLGAYRLAFVPSWLSLRSTTPANRALPNTSAWMVPNHGRKSISVKSRGI